jgi:alpha-ribazole phosphatase
MELYLIRHTTPDVIRGTSYGRSDVALHANFPAECAVVKNKISDIGPIQYFCSPLQRCRKLAEELSGSPVTADERLLEIDFGEWEMKKWEGENTLPVLQGIIHRPAPGGESYEQVQVRALQCVRDVTQGLAERVALVTHAGVIRVIIADVLKMPLDNLFALYPQLGGVTRIDFNDGAGRMLYFSR